MKISKSSIISKGAKIAKNVSIGDFCYIGPNVSINENCKIMSHVYISGYTTIGTGNVIYPFASIGTDPQDLKYKGEKSKLEVGNNNKIREYVTINPGTEHGGGVTKIGNNCLLMISSHIAHDCVVGDNVIIANNVPIAGHCIVENDVIIGGNSAVQQFCNIGKGAMIGGMTGVNKNILPYTLVTGNRCSYENLNLIGLKRKNFNNSTITDYKKFIESKNFNNSEFENNDNSLILEAKQFLKRNINKLICIPD